MFTTINEVNDLTNKVVSQEAIIRAQALIEIYVGKSEIDVTDANDRMLLSRATAYQTAYMDSDEERTFEQMDVAQIMQFGQMVTFKNNDSGAPFISPLAAIACKRLSWRRARSIRTGSIFYTPPVPSDWRTE